MGRMASRFPCWASSTSRCSCSSSRSSSCAVAVSEATDTYPTLCGGPILRSPALPRRFPGARPAPVVVNCDQLEALGRRGDAGAGPVSGRKDLGYLLDGATPCADLDERADDDSHHVAQECV